MVGWKKHIITLQKHAIWIRPILNIRQLITKLKINVQVLTEDIIRAHRVKADAAVVTFAAVCCCLLYTSSPAISIDQKTTSKNPRSTVGTVTEIYDYLRLLYARIGIPHCPVCGREIKQQTIDQIVDHVMTLEERTKIQILAPVVRGRKGEHVKEFEAARKAGYVRVRVDGMIYDLSEEIKLEKNKKHTLSLIHI